MKKKFIKKPVRFFDPFEDWTEGDGTFWGCVKRGGWVLSREEIKKIEEDAEDVIEWQIEHIKDDIWEINRSDNVDCRIALYRGRIPTREFFIDLMLNIEDGNKR